MAGTDGVDHVAEEGVDLLGRAADVAGRVDGGGDVDGGEVGVGAEAGEEVVVGGRRP